MHVVGGESSCYGNRGGVGQSQAASEQFILNEQLFDSSLTCRQRAFSLTWPEPEPELVQNFLIYGERFFDRSPLSARFIWTFTRVVSDDPLQLSDLSHRLLGHQAVQQWIVGNLEAARGQLWVRTAGRRRRIWDVGQEHAARRVTERQRRF